MNMTRNKIFALLVAATVIGFASCSDETQDVNVTDTVSSAPSYTQYYTATGTITTTTVQEAVGTGTISTYKTVTTAKPDATTSRTMCNISWTDSRYRNMTTYTVTIPCKATRATQATATDTLTDGTTSSSSTERITIYNKGGTYYADELTVYTSDGYVYSPKEISVNPTADTVELKWTEEATYYEDYDDSYKTKTTPVTNGVKYTETYDINVTLTKIN